MNNPDLTITPDQILAKRLKENRMSIVLRDGVIIRFIDCDLKFTNILAEEDDAA